MPESKIDSILAEIHKLIFIVNYCFRGLNEKKINILDLFKILDAN